MYKEIGIEELCQEDNPNLIDIRSPYMYLNGTIDKAVNIPFEKLFSNPQDYLKKDEKYYIFCSNGTSSKRMCKYLSTLGYEVINIIGGYNNYKRY